jgi:hypothetical protein
MVSALCDFGSFVVQLRLKSLVLAIESYIAHLRATRLDTSCLTLTELPATSKWVQA